MAGEMLEGKTDLTTGFPDIENGAGEVLVVVAKHRDGNGAEGAGMGIG